ncbi:MAG: glycine cleavage T C-terminal barrel domain-containing protein [Planctomycetota bacterium]
MPKWSDLYARLGAEMMPWGPPLADGSVIEVAESFANTAEEEGGDFEAEYAAIRQRVGVMHLPQRAVLQLTGADVKDYLHRLCTQEINGLEGGQTARAFQLDEKGQIASDLIVHHGDESTWLEMDVFDLPWVKELIESRLFTEDVTTEDWTDQRTFLWLLGPAAVRLLTAVAAEQDADRVTQMSSMPGTHHVIDLPMNGGAVAPTTAYRWDLGGVLGVRLGVPSEHALETYGALLVKSGYEIGATVDAAFAERRRGSMRGRPVGWSAFNTVRIEEGVPRYHIDFGRNSLPAEVPGEWGIDGAVSFTKGCYLGQEVVARMKSLGHPKKMLVGLRVTDADPEAQLELPGVAGAQVLEPGEKEKIIGGVTSSTASPLRGQAGIGLAVVRWGRHQPGTKVLVPAGGRLIEAEVVALDQLVAG